MNKKVVIKPIVVAIGATVLGSLAQMPVASAEQNPFAMKSLESGYTVAFSSRKHEEAEGKCGEKKADGKAAEGSCGEGKKAKEGSSGESKAKEGSCGESKSK